MPSNLYRRGDRYYGRFSVNGELQRVSLRTSDLREARARLKAVQKKAIDQAFGVEGATAWEDAVTAYCAGILDAGGVKPGTAKRYRVSLRQLHDAFSGRTIPQITTARIAEYVSTRQKDGATNATIRRDLTTLSRVLAYARSRGWSNANAADAYDRSLVREQSAVIHAPEDADIEGAALAMDVAGEPAMAAMLRFLRVTGVRTQEALNAKAEHVRDGALTILATKNSRPRTVELPAAVLPAVSRGYLFPSLPRTSGDLAGRWQWLRRNLPDGQRFRLHDLRHRFAIEELRAGRDIYDLMGCLGHSSVKVTERYLGYVPKGRREATRRLTQKGAMEGGPPEQKPPREMEKM